jgi:hypothetical protein
MGSSVGKYYDDCNDYDDLCEFLEIKSRDYKLMSKHRDEIFEKIQVENVYEFYEKTKKLIKDGWDMDHIKDFYDIK